MRLNRILFVFPGILLLAFFGWNLLADAQQEKHEDYLRNQDKIGDVVLEPGNYMVAHRHQGDQEDSEPCAFFYQVSRGSAGGARLSEENEKAKFRCRPSAGKFMYGFALSITRRADGPQYCTPSSFPAARKYTI